MRSTGSVPVPPHSIKNTNICIFKNKNKNLKAYKRPILLLKRVYNMSSGDGACVKVKSTLNMPVVDVAGSESL